VLPAQPCDRQGDCKVVAVETRSLQVFPKQANQQIIVLRRLARQFKTPRVLFGPSRGVTQVTRRRWRQWQSLVMRRMPRVKNIGGIAPDPLPGFRSSSIPTVSPELFLTTHQLIDVIH